jgi:hypothetical protein
MARKPSDFPLSGCQDQVRTGFLKGVGASSSTWKEEAESPGEERIITLRPSPRPGSDGGLGEGKNPSSEHREAWLFEAEILIVLFLVSFQPWEVL